MKVLITGAAGPRGRQLAARLAAEGHDVVGVSSEPFSEPPAEPRIRSLRLDLRQRGFEDLLRREHFDAVCHLAVHAGFRLPPAERYRINMEGSQRILALCAAHAVPRLIFSSHAAIYGSLPDNPYFMTEDSPPRVGKAFPEMQDVVTADLMAGAAMWKYPALSIVVLRSVNCLGPTSRDALSLLLRHRYVPTLIGFDPMTQVIHEADLAKAFSLALSSGIRGVFNVTGPGEIPISVVVQQAGCTKVPLPATLLRAALGRFGLPDVGEGVLEFLKHPCLLDGSRFAAATGFAPDYDLAATLHSVRAGRPL